jgi:hypothetical protein
MPAPMAEAERYEGETMDGFGQLMAYGAGALCLGVALTLWTIFALASRHSRRDSGEGCFGLILCTMALGLAACFFYLAATG